MFVSKPKLIRNTRRYRAKVKALERFEEACKMLAFAGAQPVEDVEAIELEYKKAKGSVLRYLAQSTSVVD